jgi:hypothetical protein
MSFLAIDGARHYYRLDGRDGRPAVMLSHSLGHDHSMWGLQAADLAEHFQVLRYDIRGHGASDVTAGEYSVEQLGRDALAIADALGVEHFAFCGLCYAGCCAAVRDTDFVSQLEHHHRDAGHQQRYRCIASVERTRRHSRVEDPSRMRTTPEHRPPVESRTASCLQCGAARIFCAGRTN